MITTHYVTRFFSGNRIRNTFRSGKSVRSVKSKEYVSWFNEQIINYSKQHKGNVEVSIKIHFRDKRKRDIDNFLKPCLDLLTKKQIIKDDSLIDKITIEKCKEDFNGFDAEVIIKDLLN